MQHATNAVDTGLRAVKSNSQFVYDLENFMHMLYLTYMHHI